MCLCDSVVCLRGKKRAVVLVDYLGGCAKTEMMCHPDDVCRDFGALVSLLRECLGRGRP